MSGTKFFENFEFVQYSFGNREDPVLFNNITQYVDIIDDERKGISIDDKKSRFTKISKKCDAWANNQRKKYPKEHPMYFKSFDCVVNNHSFVFKKVIQDRVIEKIFKW